MRPLVFSFSIFMLSVLGACAETSSAQQDPAVTGRAGDSTGPWYVISTADGTSTATIDNFMQIQNIAIQAHASKTLSVKDSIAISFSVVNGKSVDLSVKFFPNDSVWPFFTDREGSVGLVNFEVSERDGDTYVRGQVIGQLFPQESLTASPDVTQPHIVDLTFDTRVTLDD